MKQIALKAEVVIFLEKTCKICNFNFFAKFMNYFCQ